MSKLFRNKKGITLIELIVVMAILAILVTLGAPRFLGYTKDAGVTAMKADASIIEGASYQYALENDDQWPVALDESDAKVTVELDEQVKNIVKVALVKSGVAEDNVDTVLAEMESKGAFVKIDKNMVAPFIRSTSNDIDEYVLVDRVDVKDGDTYGNQLEGVVFYNKALVDRMGNLHSGIYELEIKAGE